MTIVKNLNWLKNLTSEAETVICKEEESHPMGFRFSLLPGEEKRINYDVKVNVYPMPPNFKENYNEFANENLILSILGGGNWHIEKTDTGFSIEKDQ